MKSRGWCPTFREPHVVALLERLTDNQIGTLEACQEVHDSNNKQIDAEHDPMVWTYPEMGTYYGDSPVRLAEVLSTRSQIRSPSYNLDASLGRPNCSWPPMSCGWA